MKNITIEVPREGVSLQLTPRAGAASGQAVVVTSDDVEIRITELASPATEMPKDGTERVSKLRTDDLEGIHKRLLKLKPTKRAAAVNSIKAMFQFDTPMTDEAANNILEALCKQRLLTIDASDKLQIYNA